MRNKDCVLLSNLNGWGSRVFVMKYESSYWSKLK